MDKTFYPLILDSHIDLFRDEASFREFVKQIESACQNTATPLLSEGKIIGLTVSKEAGKELLYDHILSEWAQDPARLDRIRATMQESPVNLDGI